MTEIENTAQKLGQRIKEARQAKRLSQAMLGNRCGVQRAQISKLEKDVTQASMELFLKICDILKFEIVWRGNPQTSVDERPNFESILGRLSLEEREALGRRARLMLEQTTPLYRIDFLMIQKKMLELLQE